MSPSLGLFLKPFENRMPFWQCQHVSEPDWLQPAQWLPVSAPQKNNLKDRSAVKYVEVVAQFQVLTASRYRAYGANTFCKTFVWDVLSALGVGDVAAHWVDSQTGQPSKAFTFGALETRANDVVRRLSQGLYGWTKVRRGEATLAADKGRPTVVGWQSNGATSGHLAVVLPGGNIAQAGAVNLWNKPVESGFGLHPVSFFTTE